MSFSSEEEEDQQFDSEELEDEIQNKKRRLRKGGSKHEKSGKYQKQLQLFDEEVDEDDEEESLNDYERTQEAKRRMEQTRNLASRKQRPDFLDENIENVDDFINEKYGQLDENELDEGDYDDLYDDIGVANLIPGKKDPKIFSVEVTKNGIESELALQLLNKYRHVSKTNASFKIISVSAFESQQGKIFIEAHRKIDVTIAIRGLDGIRGQTVTLIKDTDIPKVFASKQIEQYDIQPKQFVKIKMGAHMPYSGDIGQVESIDADNRCSVKIIKRVGDTNRGSAFEMQDDNTQNKKNRFQRFQKYTMENRPAKDPSNMSKIMKIHCKNLITNFELAEHRQDLLDLADMQDFAQFFEEYKDELAISCQHKSYFKPGDQVKVKQGDFTGLRCKIISIQQKQAKVQPLVVGLEKEEWEIFLEELAKFFKPTQHVEVISGRYLGTTGEIISINQYGEAKITTDNLNSITVDCNFLIQSEKRNVQTTESLNNLKRLDLIKMTGFNGVGIVLRITADSITVLDSNARVQVINKMMYDSKIDTTKNQFKTHHHDVVQTGSTVFIKAGYYKGVKAQVKHVYKDICYLFSDDFNNANDNIIVERANMLQVQSQVVRKDRMQPIFNERQKQDQKNNLNEKEKEGQHQRPNARRDDNSMLIGNSQRIKSGIYKGLYGIIKQINGEFVKVEIPIKQKTVLIKLSDIKETQNTQKQGQTPSYNPQSVHYQNQSPAYTQSPAHYRNKSDF